MSIPLVFPTVFVVIAALALSSCVPGGATYQGHRVGGMVQENGHANPVPIDF